jgi:hypothetical protein
VPYLSATLRPLKGRLAEKWTREMSSTGQPQEMGSRSQALLAAEQLLVGTADSIDPGTPAVDLLKCVERYRAHLVNLAAACRRSSTPGTVSGHEGS